MKTENKIKMKSRKSQFQFFETIGVLIIIFFFIFIGLIFYSKFEKTGFQRFSRQQASKTMIEFVQSITTNPLLSCSSQSVTKAACIDELKALSVAKTTKNFSDYYQKTFGKSTIRLEKFYPENASIVIFNNSIPSANLEKAFIPINSYNPLNDTYNIGVLVIERYYKT